MSNLVHTNRQRYLVHMGRQKDIFQMGTIRNLVHFTEIMKDLKKEIDLVPTGIWKYLVLNNKKIVSIFSQFYRTTVQFSRCVDAV